MGTEARINGRLVLDLELKEPEQGPWVARAEIDADEVLRGLVTIVIGTAVWNGYAEGDLIAGRGVLRIVGGAGGLRKELPAKYYYRPLVRQVLDDLMRETGELLDLSESDPVLLTRQLSRWTRLRCSASVALSELAREVGGKWRVLRRGSVALVTESWPELDMPGVVLFEDAARQALEVGPDDEPLLKPGVSWRGRKIAEATTHLEQKALRQELTIAGVERPRSAAQAITDVAKRANEMLIAFSRWYPSRVVAQDPDGTVQLVPDDERMRGNGLTKVPLRHGLPGCKVRVVPGQRVLLFFEDSDPKKPAAGLWPDGSSVQEVVLTAESRVVIGGPMVLLGSAAADHPIPLGDELVDWLKNHTHPTAMGPSDRPLEQATLPGVLSTKHKLDG